MHNTVHNTDTKKRRDGPEWLNVGVSAEWNEGDGKQTGRQGGLCRVWLGGKVGDPGSTGKKGQYRNVSQKILVLL